MKKVLFFIIVLLFISCKKESKSVIYSVECPNYLGYDIIRTVEKPIWLPDSIQVDFMGNHGYLIIKDCGGNADLILYNDKKNIILKGEFKKSNIYKNRKLYDNQDSIRVNIPLIDGVWEFKNFIPLEPNKYNVIIKDTISKNKNKSEIFEADDF